MIYYTSFDLESGKQIKEFEGPWRCGLIIGEKAEKTSATLFFTNKEISDIEKIYNSEDVPNERLRKWKGYFIVHLSIGNFPSFDIGLKFMKLWKTQTRGNARYRKGLKLFEDFVKLHPLKIERNIKNPNKL